MTRRLAFELVLVVLVSLAVLVPGITSYSLVDPWETHYGEVARNMVKDADLVHTQWPGTNAEGDANEGFHSKPVLTFWLMAAAMHAVGLDHVYSGEMVHDVRTMVAIRLPFILVAIFGLTMMWWMLARLVGRRLAWLALLVVGSCPFFCLVARQGIPDMALVATVIGSIAMFAMAIEDGDRSITRVLAIRGVTVDARHVLLAICGVAILGQAVYYAAYFRTSSLGVVGFPHPEVILPALTGVMFAAVARPVWNVLAIPLGYLLGALVWPFTRRWHTPGDFTDHVLRMAPIQTMRQVYLLACYALLGVSILAKGPPGLAVVGFVGVFHIVLGGRWREFYEGGFELKRGLLLMIAIFLPWHFAMFLKDGPSFINDYVFSHLFDRAAIGSVDKSFGTFEHYTSQLGHGMWLWAALLPAAIAATLLRTRIDTRAGRVRFLIALWAICGVAFFSLVQTKFHHYILPVVPALGILVAFYLDDLWQGRDRLHPLYAALAIGIVLLVMRDLVWQPERWIDMFIYRYDRPWPSVDPWHIDPSDAFLGLGAAAAFALAIAASRWRRVGVIALCISGLAICLWSLHVYMPIAGTHWGMREAMRTYYERRTIYGEKLVYSGARELYEDWHDVGDTWTFETFIPDTLQIGQPMTLSIVIEKPTDDRVTEHELALVGRVTHIGDHSVDVALPPLERARLAPLLVTGYYGHAGHRPIRAVDADRLIAWRLYWRGEQFWSGGEIWDALPEMKTTFPQEVNNNEVTKYLNDRVRAPAGRRYFVITESGHISGIRSILPTPRGRDSFEILDTTSNKFSLGAFTM